MSSIAWQPLDVAAMPHHYPALLIDAVADIDADHGKARCFATGLDGLQMIEAAAQAIAAVACARAVVKSGTSREKKALIGGLLISVNGMFPTRAVQAGVPLTIAVHTHHRISAMSAHNVTVMDGGDGPVMTGECQVVAKDPNEGPAFLRGLQEAALAAGLPGMLGVPMTAVAVAANPEPAAGHTMLPFSDAAAALSERNVVGDEVLSRLCFSPDLPVFAGHFPGNPVVPGVYLLAAALHNAVPGGRLIGVDRAKWLAPLLPGQVGSVFTKMQRDGGRMIISAKIGFQPGRPTGHCCECRMVVAS
jgi:3-hydroxyacyl-[acyl-carrier-protein] dehydratase